MDRKAYLLSSLKKQVLQLKDQLNQIERGKKNDRSNNKSITEGSERFNSNCYDSTYLDRGVKKFPSKKSKHKNLSELISEKSMTDRTPRLSSYRKAEYEKTKENFSTESR